MSTDKKIHAAAEQNTRLLKSLSDTDYAVSAHQQSVNYLTTLNKQANDDEAKLRDLSKIVASEYADHKKYRDSHMRRFASRLKGKKEEFKETASKEEKEWLDAVQQELIAKTALEHLKLNIAEAQQEVTKLSDILSVRNATQAELDQLYKSIFDGPTPDVSGEDEKEGAVRDAESKFNAAQLSLGTENQVKTILLDCLKLIKKAIHDILDALDANSMDAWGFADSIAEWQESNALSSCYRRVTEAQMLYSSAQRVQPIIRDLAPIRVAKMDVVGDVIFDNIFSDLHMRDKLKETQDELNRAKRNIDNELKTLDERQKKASGEVDEVKAVLDDKRKELQDIRAAAFGKVGQGQEDAPPSYDPPGYKA